MMLLAWRVYPNEFERKLFRGLFNYRKGILSVNYDLLAQSKYFNGWLLYIFLYLWPFLS